MHAVSYAKIKTLSVESFAMLNFDRSLPQEWVSMVLHEPMDSLPDPSGLFSVKRVTGGSLNPGEICTKFTSGQQAVIGEYALLQNTWYPHHCFY